MELTEKPKLELTQRQKYVLYRVVQAVREEKLLQVTLGGYAGTGKAQPLNSLIATPNGFVKMGDLKLNDDICTPSGRIAKVNGIFPQGVKSIYKITFSDGHSVNCCNDHLWKVIDRRRLSNLKKYKSPYKIFPLSYIKEYLNRTDGKNRFYINTISPIEFKSQDVPLDGYFLGLLLGDGSITSDNFAIHTDDIEIKEACEKELKNWDCHLKYSEGVTYNIVGDKGRSLNSDSVLLRNTLRKLNIWNCVCETKFIPYIYLQNDIKIRFSVLQGLMDSDGTVDRRTGMTSLTTTSSRLAADVCFLVESLGGICRIKVKKPKCRYKGEIVIGQDAYILNIGFNDTPTIFKLERKKKLAKCRTKYKTRRCIRAIEYIGEEKAQCIMIDDPEHLYITDHFVPTHNTTLAKYITKFFPNFAVCAYTGKAANVLRRKEINASTIHSLIYQPVYEYNRLVGFDLVPPNEFMYEGIIVDESSMVSREIYEDLQTYKLPLICIGDHGQLMPVGTDFNLMQSPDFTLEEIHRNAGDIAKFAEHLRKGFRSISFQGCEKVKFKSQKKVTTDDLLAVDQVICAYNQTRVKTNAQIREGLGFTGLLNVGERVMFLKNNKSLGLFNGMQGEVKDLYEDDSGRKIMDFESNNFLYRGIWYDQKQFGKEKPEFQYTGKVYPAPVDYAYCITTHKAQGDEWNKVGVIEQKCAKWDHKRWAYTGASRGKDELSWFY